MASLPASGTLTVEDIGTFFNDTAPYSLSSYYRGGGKVPNIAANLDIPLAGSGDPIAVSMFYGAKLLDPVAVLTSWWTARASLTKSYTNTYLGDAATTNGANWGRGNSTYPCNHINTPPDGGG